MSSALIESLDHEGRGVAHVEGKTIFVEGALPGELVTFSSYRRKPNYELAMATSIVVESSQRAAPRCRFFDRCGGCSMQHLHPVAQAAAKQRVLEDALWHIGRLRPEVIYPAIHGLAWGYRYRARLSVRQVKKKGGVLVGFHEKRSSYVAEMSSCEVLQPHVSALIPGLRELIGRLSVAERLPQIEVAVGEALTVLVLRILQPVNAADEALLRGFAYDHGVVLYLQSAGPDSAAAFHPRMATDLAYTLPEFDVTIRFRPTDFTQVNHGINRMLVRRAMALLDPQPGERIADMFCGLGNFALPIARRGAAVVGVEAGEATVRRARENAHLNGLGERTCFVVANLFEMPLPASVPLDGLEKMLVDPPREGAISLVKSIGERGPRRIVYVSCNPATLARDAAVLVHEKGYTLQGAGIANMFSHTSHVESIALFERT
jgi:23S rRNA (uracil1939-C5)-methyltransferase